MEIFARKEILKLFSKLAWDVINGVEKYDIIGFLSQIPHMA